jgi:hypothetical protein
MVNLSSAALKTYQPEHAEGRQAFIDHGIGAALFELQIGSRLINAWSGDVRCLPLSLGTLFRSKCEGHEKLTLDEVFCATILHNIYPEHFVDTDDKRFRIDLDSMPFAFFAAFCDSLQPWDRKRLVNAAYSEPAYNTVGEEFDITIRGEFLYISESGYGLNIEDRLNSLKRHLDSYLSSASRLVRLKLAEK